MAGSIYSMPNMNTKPLSMGKVRLSRVEKIEQELRQNFKSLAGGSRLPTIREMMRRFEVSQLLIQRALEPLKREGLIETIPGEGLFLARASGLPVTARRVSILRYDYPSRQAEEISRALHQVLIARKHQSMMLTFSHHDHAIDVLRGSRPADAYILEPRAPIAPVELLHFLRSHSKAVVLEGYPARSTDVDAVAPDELISIELAMRHLVELGHRRIAFASGEPPFMESEALHCFLSLHRAFGLPADVHPVVQADTPFASSSRESIRDYLLHYLGAQRALPFTALIVGTYASAEGVMDAFRKVGISVPREVSLVVMDNPDVHTHLANQFTMVGCPGGKVSQMVVDRIEWRWANPDARHETVYCPPALVVRGTTQPPPRN